MSRPQKVRFVLRKNEVACCAKIKRGIKKMPLWTSQAKTLETTLNKKLKRHLEKTVKNIRLENEAIQSPKFAGEIYRPEYFIRGTSRSYPLCGFECKRLTRASHKRNFKEALSQALLYSSMYKHVFIVLYDFSKNRVYSDAFGPGNKIESSFSKVLKKSHNVEIICIPAKAS